MDHGFYIYIIGILELCTELELHNTHTSFKEICIANFITYYVYRKCISHVLEIQRTTI